MIIIRMSGGLERQLFQYALYMKLTSMGREVKFDDISEYRFDQSRPIMLSVFGIDYPRASRSEIVGYLDNSQVLKDRIRRLFKGTRSNIYYENGYYDPKVLEVEEGYLYGKFMSQKYFEDILPMVHEAYRFPTVEYLNLPPRANINFLVYYDRIIRTESVGIHIRRSDSRFNEEVYENICTTEYYRAAIAYIMERVENARFFIFSNEPKWIKTLLKEIIRGFIDEGMSNDEIRILRERFVLVEANDEYTSYLDLFLLSKCRHNILSNSTFSWWGTWMNENQDKIVIAPNIWVNNENAEDIYTEGMVLINSKGRVEKKIK